MAYIGNDLRSNEDYKIIDDISSGFNGSATSFALQVGGATPVPFPKFEQQLLISVNGVIQEPDPTGSAGFKLSGTNIVFSSAPTNGHAFFGVIYAGADYVNAGGTFPDGSINFPSITFSADTNTGFTRTASGTVALISDGTKVAQFPTSQGSSGQALITDGGGNLSFGVPTAAFTDITLADSIIHSGDTNTKIRFPAADTVSVETSGSERLRVDSSGNVGIGTTSPSDLLDVTESSASAAAASTASVAQFERAGNVGITISTADTGDATIFFGDTASSTVGRVNYDHNDNSLGFWVNSNERMRIDSSGRLLIGSTSALSHGGIESHLQVLGTGTDDSSITLSRFSNNVHSPYIAFAKSRNGSVGGNTVVQSGDSIGRMTFFGNDGTDGNTPAAEIDVEVDGTPGSNDMPGRIVFRTTSDGASSVTERMRIDSSGDVTVNFDGSSQTGQFKIADGSASSPGLTFWADGSNDTGIFRSGANTLNFSTGGSERMRIDSSGKVGIGTTPDAGTKLHIHQTDASAGNNLKIENNYSSGGTTNLLIASRQGDAVQSVLQYKDADTRINFGTSTGHDLSIMTNGAERLRIKSGGNVGIGTTNPAGKFAVSDGTVVAEINPFASSSGAFIGTRSNHHVLFKTNATERMRLTTAGKLIVGSTADLFSDNAAEFVNSTVNAAVGVRSGTGASNQDYITFKFGGGPTACGGIRRDGTTQGPEFFSNSDRRIKTNILDMDNTLDKINQLSLKKFDFKDGSGSGIGLVAQDLISIFPNKVKKDASDDGTGDTVPDGVDPWTVGHNFTYEILKAIQELTARVAVLEAA